MYIDNIDLYISEPSKYNPLRTWSLSVEEQFYTNFYFLLLKNKMRTLLHYLIFFIFINN